MNTHHVEVPKPTPSLPEGMETDRYMPSGDEEWSPGTTEPTSKVQDEVSLNLSSVSDVSLESSPGDGDLRDGPKTPPMDTSKPTLVNVSDISSDFDNDQSLDGPKEEAPANQAEKEEKEEENEASALQEAETVAPPADKPEDIRGEDVPSNQAVVVKDTISEEALSQVLAADEEIKSAECAESATSIATTEDAAEGDVPHPLPAEAVSLQESAPPSPTAMGTPTKTPGKRKVRMDVNYNHCPRCNFVKSTVTVYVSVHTREIGNRQVEMALCKMPAFVLVDLQIRCYIFIVSFHTHTLGM